MASTTTRKRSTARSGGSTTRKRSTTRSSSTKTKAKREAKSKASELAQKSAGPLKDQLDSRSTQAGERIGGGARDLRSVGRELRNQGNDGPAKLVDQAADRVEGVGAYLRESGPDKILGDAEDFARNQPWAVLAGGLALGFAGARFLKSSSSERYSARSRS
jgi:hypothetical protein